MVEIEEIEEMVLVEKEEMVLGEKEEMEEMVSI